MRGARAFGHLAGDNFAHRTVFGERFGLHTEGGLLGFIAVRAMTREENSRCAGDIGKVMGEQSAGARFGHGEGFTAHGELADDDVFHQLVIDAINLRA